MRRLQALVFFFFLVNVFYAQESYSRVKIDLTQRTIGELASLGIETDHGEHKKGRYLINDLSDQEIRLLVAADWDVEILIPAVDEYYVAQNQNDHLRTESRDRQCFTTLYSYETPQNYSVGSMGGYFTYQEMLDHLDLMRTKFPTLISERSPIGDHLTEEGRPIYWLKLGANPDVDEEDKPEVLYTALHHAREPASLSQMIFYMWYLLENYESDGLVRYIVDSTELFFIPCINPDGYLYNESTNPNGGGLWRKNRAVVNDNIAGVDLNRNYGYEWAHDNQGSSDNPNSNTYRGTAAFSEPETEAVEDFCSQHNFKIALNYHSYGNLLIYPWGYSDSATEDDLKFKGIGQALTSENSYRTGTGTETVGYIVNGGSDDWMYGEMGVYALTPEVGSSEYGFWPPAYKIDELNKSALKQNLVAALLQHEYLETKVIDSKEGYLTLRATKFSFDDGRVDIFLESLDDALTFGRDRVSFKLNHLETAKEEISYEVGNILDNNDGALRYILHKQYEGFTISDTLEIIIPIPLELAFIDRGTEDSQWKSERWGLTSLEYSSDSLSWTDSPNGDYPSGQRTSLTMIQSISLQDCESALLEFYAKWDIEKDFDYAQVLLSTDSLNYTPLCGEYTTEGNEFQNVGEPLYEGLQSSWVKESIDLSAFLGERIHIKFEMVSDDFQEYDGIYLDDIFVKIQRRDNTSSIIHLANENRLSFFPNPAQDLLSIRSLLNPMDKLVIYDSVGGQIESLRVDSQESQIDIAHLANGMYFVLVEFADGTSTTERFVKK